MSEIQNYCGIILTNGAVADMTADTPQEAMDALDNLLSMMVMENFKEILRTATKDGNYDRGVEMLKKEARHVVENEFIDYKGAFEWFLTTLVLKRFKFFLDHVIAKQNGTKTEGSENINY